MRRHVRQLRLRMMPCAATPRGNNKYTASKSPAAPVRLVKGSVAQQRLNSPARRQTSHGSIVSAANGNSAHQQAIARHLARIARIQHALPGQDTENRIPMPTAPRMHTQVQHLMQRQQHRQAHQRQRHGMHRSLFRPADQRMQPPSCRARQGHRAGMPIHARRLNRPISGACRRCQRGSFSDSDLAVADSPR